ncbi:hypothetical protein Pryu01_02487 [Paraliobacillus ryukyuensis]|uniref:HSP20 family protein n=1 Tax=Paraliobacillus ryukyuensis TaxID=200904 RepID=A0A366DTV6_9BACI|nr:Hsp20/alpha crystallin family protein [Paraliobacillus ryukyuensis]RBO93526.1 HSP20 family protein [Paraliobacillus ryukyuensis]
MNNPFEQMQGWKQNMDHFFGENFWNGFDDVLKPPIPQVNMYQTEKEIICYVSLPGVERIKDIDVFVRGTTLVIAGTIKLDQSGQVIKEEILHGAFDRKLDLPYAVREDKVDATYRYGLLVIRLHRYMQQDGSQKRISIKQLDED